MNLFGYASCLAGTSIPVYIEDNHASSFYFFADILDLDKEYTLLLFDKHSDSGQLLDSDSVRNALRARKPSRHKNFARWKKIGAVQCLNWIEPLMPNPIAKVFWIANDRLSPKEKSEKQKGIKNEINMHSKTYWRQAEDLSTLYAVEDFRQIKKNMKYKHPLIVSIDLDYFSELNLGDIPKAFQYVVEYIFSLNHIKALSISISYPYLKSKEQVDLLLYLTFKYLTKMIFMICFVKKPAWGQHAFFLK